MPKSGTLHGALEHRQLLAERQVLDRDRSVSSADQRARSKSEKDGSQHERSCPAVSHKINLGGRSDSGEGQDLAGLAAAKWLTQHTLATVKLFEAHSEFGGRVRSNTTFSPGRITEAGAELLGSFHLLWKQLALDYGLTWFGRMDRESYARAGLTLRMSLDKLLSATEIAKIEEEMRDRVLRPMAKMARQIKKPARPWEQKSLEKFDKMSVADALLKLFKVKKDSRLWKSVELLVVNNYVAPLDEMNFLGLLCLVRGGQLNHSGGALMAYWDELEIFRCANGCQALATKIVEEIEDKKARQVNPPTIKPNTMVTGIKISGDGVKLTLVPVVKGDPDLKKESTEDFKFVILAIPPSVWSKLTIEPHDPKDAKHVGLMGMGNAAKFFSNMSHRFWIKDKAAPNGGSLKLGMVWEGTDNQTRVRMRWPGADDLMRTVDQGIVLSVFTGARTLTETEFKNGLTDLYPKYEKSLIDKNNPHGLAQTLLADWSAQPFIRSGYVSPKKGQIFTIGKKLTEPFDGRLFFAGEHTQMDFFGYMEGALRSGVRAAIDVMRKACPTAKMPAAKKPSAAYETQEEEERGFPSIEESPTDEAEDTESPFMNRELLVEPSEQEWEPRAAALAAESPFLQPAAEALEIEALETDEESENFRSDESLNVDEEDESSRDEDLEVDEEEESSSDESLEVEEEDESASNERMEVHEDHESTMAEGMEAEEEHEPATDERMEVDEEDEQSSDEAAELDEAEEEDLQHFAEEEIDPEVVDELEHPEKQGVDEGPSVELFVPNVSLADLRTRIDEYRESAKAEYTLPDGSMVRVWPQFRYGKAGGIQDAIKTVKGILGKSFEKAHPRAIHMAAYGRAKPRDIAAITQGLIDAGKFQALKDANPGASNEQLVKGLQNQFRIGIDCAGYVQLAFIHAYMGSDDDPPSVRRSLGLHEKRGWEKLADLPKKHFTKVDVLDGQTGDLFVFEPRAGDSDRAWHTVIIVGHTVSDPVHTFLCDASWGNDAYTVAAGGVGRRELKHDTSTGKWWDVHPLTGLDANVNSVGPYKGHKIHGVYRPKQKK